MPADYLHDDEGDLLIQDGDFVVGESTTQHQSLLLMSQKGELRQYPKTGVGMVDFLNNNNLGEAYQEIQKQFEADGLKIRKVEISVEGKTYIDAFYP